MGKFRKSPTKSEKARQMGNCREWLQKWVPSNKTGESLVSSEIIASVIVAEFQNTAYFSQVGRSSKMMPGHRDRTVGGVVKGTGIF